VFPVRVSNPRLEAARERIAREALEEELFGL